MDTEELGITTELDVNTALDDIKVVFENDGMVTTPGELLITEEKLDGTGVKIGVEKVRINVG